ncbi:hypothetical protein [Plantactinospora sp. DSM 117369]
MSGQHGGDAGELIAVEGALVLANDHRVEPPALLVDGGQQCSGLRAGMPRQTTRAANVEVLADDLTLLGHGPVCQVELPSP